jgi:hypothetical protein
VIAAFCSTQPFDSTKDLSSERFAGPEPFLINRLDQRGRERGSIALVVVKMDKRKSNNKSTLKSNVAISIANSDYYKKKNDQFGS